jgi:hypothetical protein
MRFDSLRFNSRSVCSTALLVFAVAFAFAISFSLRPARASSSSDMGGYKKTGDCHHAHKDPPVAPENCSGVASETAVDGHCENGGPGAKACWEDRHVVLLLRFYQFYTDAQGNCTSTMLMDGPYKDPERVTVDDCGDPH